uniref:Uncharacterized protein n=1 Tax=Kalanchoe fedtschenkoi TaxID=63787 RepID=A0A7N0UZM6_KALFE
MWSFDSDSLSSLRYKLGGDLTVGSQSWNHVVVCSGYLLEKSSFNIQKIVPNNELSVVAVLVCGHTRIDCLDHLTLEINKYKPSCPVCTFEESYVIRMCEKLLMKET